MRSFTTFVADFLSQDWLSAEENLLSENRMSQLPAFTSHGQTIHLTSVIFSELPQLYFVESVPTEPNIYQIEPSRNVADPVDTDSDTSEESDTDAFDKCPICYKTMKETQKCITLPCSGSENAHKFHALCLKRALHVKLACPICRKNIDQDVVTAVFTC